ncbi:MAG: sensor histidine kinase [Putridiphycobacter sp.]
MLKWFSIILVFVTVQVKAQQLELALERPHVSEKLSTEIVYSISQSDEGYLYFGTEDGLIKFNGISYAKINLNTRGKAVHNVVCNQNKVYGLTFSQEFFIYSNDTLQIFDDVSTYRLSKLSWFKIIGDSIFLFSPNAFQIINKNNMEVVFERVGEDLPLTWDVFMEDEVLNVLFGYFQLSTLNNFMTKEDNEINNKLAIKPLTFKIHHENFALDTKQKKVYKISADTLLDLNWNLEALKHQKIHSVETYQNKMVVVATYDGLFFYNQKGEMVYRLLKGVPVSNVFESAEGQLWVATLNDGVYFIPSLSSTLLNLSQILGQKDKINKVLFDNPNLVLGTHQGRLIKYNFKTGEMLSEKMNSRAEVQSLSKIKNSYYAYCEKLYELDTNLEVLDSIVMTATKSVINFNDTLYLGTSQGISVLKDHQTSNMIFPNRWFKSLYHSVTDSQIIGNTDYGLYQLDLANNSWTYDTAKLNFKSNLKTGLEGYVAENELIINSAEKFNLFTIPFDFENYFLADNQALILLYQDSVVVHDLSSSKVMKIQKTIDYPNEKIINCDFYKNQLVMVFDSRVQFIDLNQPKLSHQPNVIVTHCSTPVKNGQIKLPFQGGLSFQIDVLPNIQDMGNTHLYYKIEAMETGWVEITPNKKNYELNLERLPHGEYSIDFKAVSLGNMASDLVSYTLSVATPYWLRWWFILLFILILLLLGLSVMRFRLNRLRKKNLNEIHLKRLEIQSLNSKLEALQSQMNPHFIFNSLNSIQTLVLKGDVESSYEYINKFADLMRQTLSFSETQLVPFHEEVDLLNNYLLLEKLRFRDDFNYQIITNDIKEVSVPPMLLQPLIENALKHGLLHKKSDRQLTIEFKLEKDLICTIIDNGVGRKAANEIKKRQNKSHKSYAIESLKERFEYLRQKMNFENIGFTYHDLYEKDLPAGTKVVVIIPFVKNN